jgi:hypothetical protein
VKTLLAIDPGASGGIAISRFGKVECLASQARLKMDAPGFETASRNEVAMPGGSRE